MDMTDYSDNYIRMIRISSNRIVRNDCYNKSEPWKGFASENISERQDAGCKSHEINKKANNSLLSVNAGKERRIERTVITYYEIKNAIEQRKNQLRTEK